MKDFKILWIDDDWKTINSNEYNILEKIYHEIIKNRNINIERFSTIDGGVHQLTLDFFDFVIIDLDFQNEDKDSRHKRSASNIINSIIKYQPKFAILTNHSNADVFLSNNEIEKVEHLLYGIYQKSEDSRNQLISDIHAIASFSPINILQFSDFHFDSTLDDNKKEEQDYRFEKLVECVSQLNSKIPIDYIVFSGDLACNNPKEDINNCSLHIRNLVNSTINDFSRLIIVPGNHDIEWEDFDNSKIGSSSGESFYNFLCDVFAGNKEVISRLVGFNPKNNSFDYNHPDSFSWSYSNENGLVKFLCLNSVIAESNHSLKGKGRISKNTISFIKHEWALPPQKNELRIAVFHHNILPPFSINNLDENSNILNSGETIEILTKHGCDIILGGHCHDSSLYKLSYSTINHQGYNKIKNIIYISTSTSGGYAPTKDRPRSFNIIRFYQAKQNEIKSIQVTPYIYDSKEKEWSELNEINEIFKQNR